MISRRQFLQYGAASAVGVQLVHTFGPRSLAQAPVLLDPFTVPQFVNPLPRATRVDATGGQVLTVEMGPTWQNLLGPGFGSTPVWGYGVNGAVSYPGPTFVAERDTPVNIQWINNLPFQHLLPVDTTLHWAFGHNSELSIETDGVPAVPHLHGGHTESASDGLPEQWFTPNKYNPDFKTGAYFEKTLFTYDNDQEAGTLWYHDHALGITRLNVYAGLAGFYLLRDEFERIMTDDLKVLPSGDQEIEIAIQDRLFWSDGRLFYPSVFAPEEILDEFPGDVSVLPEFFGDVILVNGKAWPFLNVQPRKYRFRLLNGSDSRFYNLWINSGANGNQTSPDGNGPLIIQIGTDNGFLDAPVPLEQLTLAPGERADVVVDFRGWEGQSLILRNNARIPFPKGDAVNPRLDGRIMAFVVGSEPVEDPVQLPDILRPAPFSVGSQVTRTRKLILFEGLDRYGRLQPLLGIHEPDSELDGTLLWDEPLTELPELDDVEIWEIYNATMDAHPIHLHLVSFEVLDRQKFSADIDVKLHEDMMDEEASPTMGGILKNIRLRGRPMPPALNELGPKDTVQMYPGEVTRIKARFDRLGRYVWHCHILSHEDHEMMRPYEVI